MKSESPNIKGLVRQHLGTRDARKLRRQGRLPASAQGENKEAVHFTLDEVEFLAARRRHQHLFDIELDRGDVETVLVRELAWDALGDRIVHVEFRRVVRGRKTEVDVELEFTGFPKGGILNHLVTHLTVLSLPASIPDSIEVPVGELVVGTPLLAKDIRLPEGVELAMPGDTQVAVVTIPRAEPEPEAAAAAAAAVPGAEPTTAEGAPAAEEPA
jgi:large subunit ribosomal protein L25